VAMSFCVIGIGLMPSCYLSLLRRGVATNNYGKRAGIIAASHTLGYTAGGVISAIIFKTATAQIGIILAFISALLGFACFKQSEVMRYSYATEAL
jgi:hypothetical protein